MQEEMVKQLLSSLLLLLLSTPHLVSSSSSDALESYYHRPDPLQGFKLYREGYDLRNSHYWASTVFTGVHGYVIAVIWILGGLVFLGVLRAQKKSSSSSSSPRVVSPSKCYPHLLVILAIFVFTLLAIVASGGALVASHGFHTRARKMEESLLGAAKTSSHAIHRVLLALKDIKGRVCPYNGPICTFMSAMSTELRNELVNIREAMQNDGHKFDVFFGLSYGITMGIVSLNLVLVIATIVVMLWRRTHVLIMLILACWILTGICWILTGFDFFLHVYAEDTCSAMKEFEQYPSSSSLGSILPCPKPTYADLILAQIGFGIHILISQVIYNHMEI